MDNQKAFTAAELQIMSATRAYVVLLAETAKYAKFAIYTDAGNGLQVLWAKALNYDDYKKTQLFNHQVIAGDKEKLPRFYFKVRRDWNGKSQDLENMLRAYNKTILIRYITGGCPF